MSSHAPSARQPAADAVWSQGAGDPDARLAQVLARADGATGLALLELVLRDGIAGRVALVSSFGAESAVLLDLAARIDPAVPVIFLETGKHFAETLAYREALARRLGLTDIRDIRPAATDLARHDPDGTLWQGDPDLCCHIRKTEPLDRALAELGGGVDGWITGRKRFQAASREALPAIELDQATGRLKINPLAGWSPDDIQRYLADRDLPLHPLLARGFRSIGCAPCTRATRPGEAARAGRWSWLDKTECGIHAPPL
ncbi:MAG: phosphoadenylyl-sulfate reductase [Azospirillaceae bacterium]